MKTICIACACVWLLSSTCVPQQSPTPLSLERAQAAGAVLERWYVDRTGLYATTGWWNAANAITAMVDLMRASGAATGSTTESATGSASGSGDYRAVLAHTFSQAQIIVPKAEQTGALAKMTGAPGFLNDYYDDEGWWALAWIDAYDLTGEPRYLAMAQSIFADMSGAWDQTCGGGIWWSKDRKYKNAIANELFLSVATHLAVRVPKSAGKMYGKWAKQEWKWFQGSGMINGDHLVNDGLTINQTTGACTNNGRTVWTYNQGVVVGALTEWARRKHDKKLLAEARTLADAGLAHLTDKAGVLHDVCEPAHCGGDAPQFKGIFVRNLRALDQVVHDPRYAAFFQVNADSVWSNDRSGNDELGLVWSGPVGSADAATQSSALDVLVAALPDHN
jgi:predicted alpha-1,6-mannanase (GH76 family)